MRFNFYTNSFEDLEFQENKIAFSGSEKDLTWSQFRDEVNGLIAEIDSLNLPEGYPIFIYGHKQEMFTVSIVACLLSNHPFVPIDQLYPQKRIDEIKEETGTNVMIDCSQSTVDGRQSKIEIEGGKIGQNRLPVFKENPLSYVLFTSGSTGKPKGVLIRRNSILNLIDWIASDAFEMTDEEVFVNQSPFSFDVSLFDTFSTLHYGATMLMISQELSKNTEQFCEKLMKYGATYWTSTPSFIYLYQREDWFCSNKIPTLKRFLFAGEPLSPNIVKLLHERFDNSKVWNAFGPTEATVITTLLEVNDEVLQHYPSALPIGYSKPNSQMITLPENATVDAPGELVIVGENVAEGYLNRSEQTTDRFYVHHAQKAYKTGDVGYIEDGMIFCLGRNDDQMKFNGYRIELDEINQKIFRFGKIDEVRTIGLKRDGKVIRIVAMYQSKNKLDANELKSFLSDKLPHYMIPSDFLQVDQFPMNASSGKIDRNKLQEFYLAEKKK